MGKHRGMRNGLQNWNTVLIFIILGSVFGWDELYQKRLEKMIMYFTFPNHFFSVLYLKFLRWSVFLSNFIMVNQQVYMTLWAIS